jgi:hypothetical protein
MYRIGGFAVAAMGLIVLVQSASAQSNCKDLKGDLTETTPDGTNFSGTVSNAGWLNGDTHGVWTLTVLSITPAVIPAPLMSVFAHTFTITTNLGKLKATNRLFLFNVDAIATGKEFVSVVYVDPAGSTGIFAGATGTLFTNLLKQDPGPGFPFPVTFTESLSGQICFARQ